MKEDVVSCATMEVGYTDMKKLLSFTFLLFTMLLLKFLCALLFCHSNDVEENGK